LPSRPRGPLLAAVAAALLLAMTGGSATAALNPAPGGPILVVTSSADPFGWYYTEILHAEGLNAFGMADVSALSAQTLAGHDTVVLASAALTDAQVSTLGAWVQGGGNLIAIRPDKRLAPLLGLADAGGTVSNADLQIDTSQPPGAGITSSPLQFHGTADLYAPAGARSAATLSPGGQPAVSVRAVGAGHAAAVTYDLARSIVATRQGNIAWAGQNRDQFAVGANPDPITRSDDLFFGGDPRDPQPDWVDLGRVAIPQADEQQRLLANLIVQFSAIPTPRFWYFPRGEKAVIALTGDDHGSGGTNNVFDTLLALGPAGCRPPQLDRALVDSWGCPRATSYVHPDNTPIDPGVAANWNSYGFEIAMHPLFQADGSCLDFTPASLDATLTREAAIFAQKFPGVPASTTTRTHCIAWSDWDSQPVQDLAHGIRLNTDYYYFPGAWTQDRPGLFTGSGMPMRFAVACGAPIDVYQATTYSADDATLGDPNSVIPAEGGALMANALGAAGYYGAFTIQVHSDEPADAPGRNALVADAMQRGVPIISERQLLTWLDGRNSSSFQNITFGADGSLHFTVVPGAGAGGLEAMLPVHGATGSLSQLTRNGQAVSYTTHTVKGVDYAMLPDASGDYVASYPPPGPGRPSGSFGGAGGDTPDCSRGATITNPGAPAGAAGAGSAAPAPKRAAKRPRFLRVSGRTFRPGSKRAFVLTVRLPRASRLVVTFRTRHGKIVRRLRVGTHRAGTVLHVRWDGRDARRHYVAPATYRFAVTAIGAHGYEHTARGSVKVLRARSSRRT
jgi:hypothetical protein